MAKLHKNFATCFYISLVSVRLLDSIPKICIFFKRILKVMIMAIVSVIEFNPQKRPWKFMRVIARKGWPFGRHIGSDFCAISHNFWSMKPIYLKSILKMTNSIVMRFYIFQKYPKIFLIKYQFS